MPDALRGSVQELLATNSEKIAEILKDCLRRTQTGRHIGGTFSGGPLNSWLRSEGLRSREGRC